MTIASVLLIGTTFELPRQVNADLQRTAGMIGRELARADFGLITGNPPGVESAAAAAYGVELLEWQKTILPVLVGGAQLPAEHELPEPLKPLLSAQAFSLDNTKWASSLRTMIQVIESALRPCPPSH
jgi:hypothetical protein